MLRQRPGLALGLVLLCSDPCPLAVMDPVALVVLLPTEGPWTKGASHGKATRQASMILPSGSLLGGMCEDVGTKLTATALVGMGTHEMVPVPDVVVVVLIGWSKSWYRLT